MNRSEKEKMLAGEPYSALDPELQAERLRARILCREFNHLEPGNQQRRADILRELMGSLEPPCNIETGFHCDYGYNIHLGANFYANFGLIILDPCTVRIGRNCMCGPRVSILTATHPVDPQERNSGLESGRPITIGDNVWLGAGAIVNPGVTIGDNVVVGSGSVVTRDVEAGCIVGGVPARVIRKV